MVIETWSSCFMLGLSVDTKKPDERFVAGWFIWLMLGGDAQKVST